MRRKLSAFIALTTTTACTSWQVQPGPTPSVVQTAREHSVQPLRLNMNSGASVEIYEATVVDDSIVGMNGPSTQASRNRIAVATKDVESVATNDISPGRTIGALALITLAVLIIIGISQASTTTTSSSNSSCGSTASAAFAPAPVVA